MKRIPLPLFTVGILIVFIVLFLNSTPPKSADAVRGWEIYGLTGTPTAYNYLPVVLKYATPTLTSTVTPTKTTTPTATATKTVTLPPAITGNIQIISIYYNGSGSSEPDEYVVIQNQDNKSIQVQNWTLRDNASHIFQFPSFVMIPNQVCRVYTNQDHPEWCGFNYHSGSANWNNTGDCAFLRDSTGTQIDSLCY